MIRNFFMKAQKVKGLSTHYVLSSVVWVFLHEVHEMNTKLGHHICLSDCMSHHQSFPNGIWIWYYGSTLRFYLNFIFICIDLLQTPHYVNFKSNLPYFLKMGYHTNILCVTKIVGHVNIHNFYLKNLLMCTLTQYKERLIFMSLIITV
jgi:hypothetical protein